MERDKKRREKTCADNYGSEGHGFDSFLAHQKPRPARHFSHFMISHLPRKIPLDLQVDLQKAQNKNTPSGQG
jgi:hypothetical protein